MLREQKMSWLRTAAAALLALAGACCALDPGPTYGKDYAGGDYNVTQWHSPASMAPNHWIAAAKECQVRG